MARVLARGTPSWKIGTPFGTLARLMAHWSRSLACWLLKLRSWHAFDTLALRDSGKQTGWHVDYVSIQVHRARDLANSFFFPALRVDILERKNIFSQQAKKSVIVSVQSIYSLCDKTEKHS